MNVHSGGSIDADEHARRLKVKLGRESTYYEIYEQLHRPKGKPNEFLTKHQENIGDTYRKRVAESESGGDGSSSLESQNSIYLDVVGGRNKKGRVYGLGSKASSILPSSSTSYVEGVTQEEVTQMKSKIEDLSLELQRKNAEQEMMKQKMEQWEQMFQKMMTLHNLKGLEEDDIDEDQVDNDN